MYIWLCLLFGHSIRLYGKNHLWFGSRGVCSVYWSHDGAISQAAASSGGMAGIVDTATGKVCA